MPARDDVRHRQGAPRSIWEGKQAQAGNYGRGNSGSISCWDCRRVAAASSERIAAAGQGGASNGKLSGRAGPGRCSGGSLSSSEWVLPVGSSAACWPPGWKWSSAGWRPPRPAGSCGSGPARTLRAMSFQADQAAGPARPGRGGGGGGADRGCQWRPGPLGQGRREGLPVVAARCLPSMLASSRRCSGPNGSPT